MFDVIENNGNEMISKHAILICASITLQGHLHMK